jgi:hypothetical protein
MDSRTLGKRAPTMDQVSNFKQDDTSAHLAQPLINEDVSLEPSVEITEPPVFKALSLFLKEYAWDKSLVREEKVA